MEILAFLNYAATIETPNPIANRLHPSQRGGNAHCGDDTSRWLLTTLGRTGLMRQLGIAVACWLTIGSLWLVFGVSAAVAGILLPGQVLSRGDQNDQVRQLQTRLRDEGFFPELPTGFYGPLTAEAVTRYQRTVGLEPDGVFGPETDRALFDDNLPLGGSSTAPPTNFQLGDRVLRRNDTGSDVRDLQELLNERVAFTNIDGDFGAETEERVRQFQAYRAELTVDGIVGPATLAALRTQPPGPIPLVPIPSPTPSPPPSGTTAQQASANAASINRGSYVVVIPTDSGNRNQLSYVRRDFGLPEACMASSRRGSYIFAGGYPDYSSAESMRLRLRGTRPSPDTSRLDARIDYRRDDDFTVDCLY